METGSQQKKCAHSVCTCNVSGDDTFCCEQCKINAYSDDLECGCGCPHCGKGDDPS